MAKKWARASKPMEMVQNPALEHGQNYGLLQYRPLFWVQGAQSHESVKV